MRYNDLKALLEKHLPGVDESSLIEGETLDSAYVFGTVKMLLASHKDEDELNKKAYEVLKDMLSERFKYLRQFPELLYTNNTVLPTNKFCVALASEMQEATGENRFKLLMPTIDDTECLTGLDLAENDVAVTDFILGEDQARVIDVMGCLETSKNDTILRRSQFPGNVPEQLSEAEKESLLNHLQEAQEYYDAIKTRSDFKRDGTTLGAALQLLTDGLARGSTRTLGYDAAEYNAGAAANEAINRFAVIYDALPEQIQAELNTLFIEEVMNDERIVTTFQQLWHILTAQQMERFRQIQQDSTLTDEQKQAAYSNMHEAVNTCTNTICSKLQNLHNQHKQRLFAIQLNSENLQGNTIAQYDEMVANAKHWLETKLIRLREGKDHLSRKLSDEQGEALARAVLPLLNNRVIANQLQAHSVFNKAQQMAGRHHTLVVTDSGALYASGFNRLGQLGLGDNVNRNRLTQVPGITGKVVQVAAGFDQTLVVTDGGALYACGNNRRGQLGLVGIDESNQLTQVPGITGKVVQVAAGFDQTLVVTDGGELYACGENDHGQLGLGGNKNTHSQLTRVPGIIGKVVQVATGENHTLVVTDSGQLYACGGNKYGQLGLGDKNDRNQLTLVPGITGKVVQVAAGPEHTLIVTDSGQLYACGNNNFGELGLGNRDACSRLQQVPGITGKVVQVAAGYHHSLVVTDSGELYSCGTNGHGQLGLGDVKNVRSQLTQVPGITGKAVQVVAGMDHTLVVTDSGELYVCGANDSGQLGLGNEKICNKLTGVPGFSTPSWLMRINQQLMQAPAAAAKTSLFAPKVSEPSTASASATSSQDNPNPTSPRQGRG